MTFFDPRSPTPAPRPSGTVTFLFVEGQMMEQDKLIGNTV